MGERAHPRCSEGLTAYQFTELSGQFTHTIGTQCWWYRNWNGAEQNYVAVNTIADAKAAYRASHDELRSSAASLTDEGPRSLRALVGKRR